MANGVTSSISRFGLSEPFELQVGRGQITGHSLVNIFGYQESVATTFVPVWENVATIPYPGSAVAMSAVSDSASDTAVVIQIQGLDADHNLLIANLTMNGLTPVTTTALFLHVNNVVTVSGNAVGNITISNGGTTYAKINAGIGKSQMSIYSVPAGHTFYLTRVNAFSQQNGGTNNYCVYRAQQVNTNGTILTVLQAPFSGTAAYSALRVTPFPYPEKTSVQWQAKSQSNTSSVGIVIEGILIKSSLVG